MVLIHRIHRYVHEVQHFLGRRGGYRFVRDIHPVRAVIAHHDAGTFVLRTPSSALYDIQPTLVRMHAIGDVTQRTFRLVAQSLGSGLPYDAFGMPGIPVAQFIVVINAFVRVRRYT